MTLLKHHSGEQTPTAAHRSRKLMLMPPLSYMQIDTPVGTLYVAYSGTTVRYTDLAKSAENFLRACETRFNVSPQQAEDPPIRLLRQIHDFWEGKRRFMGAIDLSTLSQFQQRVLYAVMAIPRGEVRTYKGIAQEVGAPRACRAVGTALAKNPIPILIPCHRVVRADYSIGEYGCGGPAKKQEILQYEGIDVAYLKRLTRQGMRFE